MQNNHTGINSQTIERVRDYIVKRLSSELSAEFLYHNLYHTRDEVLPAVIRFAALEGIKGESLNLLITAAWFHDLGFVEQATYHELIGARIAIEVLPGFGYTNEQAEVVRWIILATALPQSPRNLIEQIMADADLAVLGSENFPTRNQNLRDELSRLGRQFTDEEWYASQIKFLEDHHYFTAAAARLCNEGKVKNIAYMNSLLEKSRKNGRG